MTCRFEDLREYGSNLGKRVTFGAAASIMATLVVASAGLLFSGPSSAADIKSDRAAVERGRYLVRTGGCNDCHTPGYAETAASR